MVQPAQAGEKPPAENRQKEPATAPADEYIFHTNERFGFRVRVRSDWKLDAEPSGLLSLGESQGMFFNLPAVWSELEQQNIKNAISVKAFRQVDKELEEFAAAYLAHESDGVVSTDRVKDGPRPAVVQLVDWRGLRYKRRMEFLRNDEFGYVLDFTATPGTYDTNYEKFREFADAFKVGIAK